MESETAALASCTKTPEFINNHFWIKDLLEEQGRNLKQQWHTPSAGVAVTAKLRLTVRRASGIGSPTHLGTVHDALGTRRWQGYYCPASLRSCVLGGEAPVGAGGDQ